MARARGDVERDLLDRIFRDEAPRALATLIRQLGDFALAEDVLQEALAEALEQWPTDGVPENPRGWLVTVGRRRAIDQLRRHTRFADVQREVARRAPETAMPPAEDDYLRLVFTCCHPALGLDAQVALTLSAVCGLSTEQIAETCLVPRPTMAQRLVRAKAKIRDAGIPYRVPPADAIAERLDAVLTVIYLVFTRGYADLSASLSAEAIRLGRHLVGLTPYLPGETHEPEALLALMLLHEARRPARTGPSGDLVLLEDQDRTRWTAALVDEGLTRLDAVVARGVLGPYGLQAAIAAEHARAPHADATDWRRIVALYEALTSVRPGPVVELNRAVAVAMADGPAAGLRIVDGLAAAGQLADYHLLWAARADFLRRLGRVQESAEAYRRAAALATHPAEQRFLEQRLAEVLRPAGS